MTEPRIQLLDDLGAEFVRVAAQHNRSLHRSRLRGLVSTPRHAFAVAFSVLALLAGGAYAVPPTRAAIEDITSDFAGWVAGDEAQAPGRALRPDDDAPDWVRSTGGRLITKKAGVSLYVTRTQTVNGTYLNFVLGKGFSVGDTIDGWRDELEDHAVIALGPTPFGQRNELDESGRFPLLAVTARSVEWVELHYTQGPPLVETGVDGGVVLIADAWRPLRELVAYDAAGRELDRVDVSHIDMRYVCEREAGCPSP